MLSLYGDAADKREDTVRVTARNSFLEPTSTSVSMDKRVAGSKFSDLIRPNVNSPLPMIERCSCRIEAKNQQLFYQGFLSYHEMDSKQSM